MLHRCAVKRWQGNPRCALGCVRCIPLKHVERTQRGVQRSQCFIAGPVRKRSQTCSWLFSRPRSLCIANNFVGVIQMRLGFGFLVVGVVALCLTAGCASQSVGTLSQFPPGTTTRGEVLAKMGPSPSLWFDASGREHWDYSGNPFSYYGYRASFDEAGKLTEWRELRRAVDVAGLAPRKSTAQDVRAALGEPNELYHIRGDAHWQWRVLRNTRPYRLVAQLGPDGVLKSVGQYPIDGCCRSSGR